MNFPERVKPKYHKSYLDPQIERKNKMFETPDIALVVSNAMSVVVKENFEAFSDVNISSI